MLHVIIRRCSARHDKVPIPKPEKIFMSVQPLHKSKSVRDQVSPEEWQLRCELAAAHRLVAHFVFVDMTYNHISARVPGEPNHFLVKPETAYMEQVTAS